LFAEIESTSNELRGIALDTMGKVSQTAHQLDVPGPEVAELQQTVDGAMAQQDDARLKLQKIKELQGQAGRSVVGRAGRDRSGSPGRGGQDRRCGAAHARLGAQALRARSRARCRSLAPT
jgi:hypothetical protein